MVLASGTVLLRWWHSVGEGETEKVAEGDAVANLEFGLIVGEVVHGLDDEHFEHEHHVERGTSGGGGTFGGG